MKGTRTIKRPCRIAIAGLGAVGMKLAHALNDGLEGHELAAVSAGNLDTARERLSFLNHEVAIVPIEELEPLADVVVECAPSHLLASIASPFLKNGKTVMVLSCGALLENQQLIDLADENFGQIIVPSGALLGLDAVSAAAEGEIESVTMVTRKPVKGLIGAPYLVENDIDISDIKEPTRIFKGTAREAAVGFPANLNVAVALSLAGVGPDKTALEIWADPALTRNMHRIIVKSNSANFEMSIENIPTENPKTGRITALSVVAALRKLNGPLRIGT